MSLGVSEKASSGQSVEEVISSLPADSGVPSLLLHVCCAPCASYVLEYLLPHFEIALLFYNPNIQPIDEYIKRASEVENRLMERVKDEFGSHSGGRVGLIVRDCVKTDFEPVALGYPDEPEGGKRCRGCFELRLKATAQLASKDRYDYFTTTLSVSPHKNADLINEIGCGLADERATEKGKARFLCADFKKHDGYKRSVELSKRFGLYRQNYCGCCRSKAK